MTGNAEKRVKATVHRRVTAWFDALVAQLDKGRHAEHGVLAGSSRLLARLIRRQVYATEWMDESTAWAEAPVLFPAEQREAVVPRADLVVPASQAAGTTVPAVRLLRFKDVVVYPEVSCVARPGHLVIERSALIDADAGRYETRCLRHVGPAVAVVDRLPVEAAPGGVFMAGSGAYNYFHFLIEIVPKWFYYRLAACSERALVSETVASTPQFGEILQVAAPEAEIHVLRSDRAWCVPFLDWVSAPTNTPMNLRSGRTPRPEDSHFDERSLGWLRDLALHRFGSAQTRSGGEVRVFLARRSQFRRYNQDEILDRLAGLGFHAVYPEDLGFGEQVRLFHEADCIVGPTGAAWANLLFAQVGAKALYWISSDMVGFSAWANLGAIAGVDVRYVPYEAVEAGPAHSAAFRVDPDMVVEAVRRMLND